MGFLHHLSWADGNFYNCSTNVVIVPLGGMEQYI